MAGQEPPDEDTSETVTDASSEDDPEHETQSQSLQQR